MDRQYILHCHDHVRDLRRREEPYWRDIAKFMRPDEQDIDRNSSHNRDGLEIFDSTALYAVDNFIGGMFGEATNPADRWFELTHPDKDLANWGPVKAWFWNQASQIYASLSPSVSNFYAETQPWFGDGGTFGNGFIYQEEWTGRQTIIDRAVPIGECFIDVDVAGNLDVFHREFRYSGRQMRQRWRDKVPSAIQDEKTYALIHAVRPNPSFQMGKIGQAGKPFVSIYLSTDNADFRVDSGYYEMPYHPLFWNKRSGKAWATGPGHNALPDASMVNEMERSNLIDAQFAAEPLILTHDDTSLTAADIVPGKLIEGALSDNGKKLVDVMQRGDNPARSEQKTEQKRASIREAFYFSIMQVVNRPQMTATEWMGWKEERLRLLGPNLVRVQAGLSAHIARRYRLLARAGQTLPPPPELAGQAVAVEFVSPMAKAQKLATGRGVLQWIGALGQIAELSQDPSVLDVVNKDGAARVLHDAMVGMPDVINDQDRVNEIRQARSAQVQQQAAVEQAAQLAGVYADVAHAKQAETAAGARGKAA